MDVMYLHEERRLMDRELAVHRKALHCFQRLVVAYGNTGVETDALGSRHRYLADDVLRRGKLQCITGHMIIT